MNQKTIKEIKKIINYEKGDPAQKRVLNKLKKQYSNLSSGARRIFLDKLQNLYNNTIN
jgi:hypothetical protein